MRSVFPLLPEEGWPSDARPGWLGVPARLRMHSEKASAPDHPVCAFGAATPPQRGRETLRGIHSQSSKTAPTLGAEFRLTYAGNPAIRELRRKLRQLCRSC